MKNNGKKKNIDFIMNLRIGFFKIENK